MFVWHPSLTFIVVLMTLTSLNVKKNFANPITPLVLSVYVLVLLAFFIATSYFWDVQGSLVQGSEPSTLI